jgi:diguanylate cyclase (GGDEF)-like protein/PAS domain S-box-containing protein
VGQRILILDDESTILDILVQLLSPLGFDCQAMQSPVTALERLKTEPFSILITDIKMPEMSGIDVVRQAKEIDPDLAIVVITALVEVSAAIQAIRAGADDYVLKPFNLNEITAAVSKALEKRAHLIETRAYQEKLEKRIKSSTEDLKRINHELRETKQYLESLFHSTVDVILTIDDAGRIEFVNEGALGTLGYSREELLGHRVSTVVAGGEDEIEYIRRVLRESGPIRNYETELKRKDGTTVPVYVSLSVVSKVEKNETAMLAICKDITEQKRLERELKEMSIKDSLTGLYNQRYFYEKLSAEIERAKRQRHPLSLALFDVDHFKSYNDTRGHLEGDRVLQTIGKVVLECTREHVDIGFRYGGDEFTVILPEADLEAAQVIAERIRKSFEAFKFDHLTLSIGLMTHQKGYSIRNFIQFTDAMMYDAKRSGGNRVFVYQPKPGDAVPEAEAETNEVRDMQRDIQRVEGH